MLESKRLPRDLTSAFLTEFKGNRQTEFFAPAGLEGPGDWTEWKEVFSYSEETKISLYSDLKPQVAEGVIHGELKFTALSGADQEVAFYPGQNIQFSVGLVPGQSVGRVMMRFRNLSKFMVFYPGNLVQVKITVGYPG